MFLPYKLLVEPVRLPWMNWLIIGCCTILHGLLSFGLVEPDLILPMVLREWTPVGLIGHQFLHGDLGHILFNMIFLWVFGNALCSRVGNGRYLLLYLLMGALAGGTHLMISGGSLIGASGAISGVIAFGIALWPASQVRSVYFLGLFGGVFTIRALCLLAFWMGRDVYDEYQDPASRIAHWAHIGGYVAGIVLALTLSRFTWLREGVDESEPMLIDYLKKGSRQEKQAEDVFAPPKRPPLMAMELSFSSPAWIRWVVGLILISSYPMSLKYGVDFEAPFLSLIGAIQIAPFIADYFGNMAGGILYRHQEGTRQPMYGIPEALAARGQYEAAEQEYEKIIQEFPDEVKPHIDMIEIAVKRLKNAALAEALYQRGLTALKKKASREKLMGVYSQLKQLVK